MTMHSSTPSTLIALTVISLPPSNSPAIGTTDNNRSSNPSRLVKVVMHNRVPEGQTSVAGVSEDGGGSAEHKDKSYLVC